MAVLNEQTNNNNEVKKNRWTHLRTKIKLKANNERNEQRKQSKLISNESVNWRASQPASNSRAVTSLSQPGSQQQAGRQTDRTTIWQHNWQLATWWWPPGSYNPDLNCGIFCCFANRVYTYAVSLPETCTWNSCGQSKDTVVVLMVCCIGSDIEIKSMHNVAIRRIIG